MFKNYKNKRGNGHKLNKLVGTIVPMKIIKNMLIENL